jgi:hypothetical protein
MSPGNQILALTAKRAKPNTSRMAAGRSLERKKDKACTDLHPFWGLPARDERRQSRRNGCRQIAATSREIQPARC